MAGFGDLSPTLRQDEEANLHPSLAGCGFAWVVVCFPAAASLPPCPQLPRVKPEAPPPGEIPVLQLPQRQGSKRRSRVWQLQHGNRLCVRGATPLLQGPSAWLRRLLCEGWLRDLARRVQPTWLVDCMGVQLYVSFFGGFSWKVVGAMRVCLRTLWPATWTLPYWMANILEGEPC